MKTLDTKTGTQEVVPVVSSTGLDFVLSAQEVRLIQEVEMAWQWASEHAERERENQRRTAERVRFSLD